MPLRRTTLWVLLSLSLLAVASRLIFGSTPGTTEKLSSNTTYGTITYVGMTVVFEDGFRVWEFTDPSCPGLLRILKLHVSGEAELLSQLLRQPDESVAYWYGGIFYDEIERPIWLFRLATEKLWSWVHTKSSMNSWFYLKIFHPTTCIVPATADWSMLASSIQ